jgi:hypothetical protein
MDRIQEFLRETYEYSITGRILVKHMYQDFERWVTAKYGIRVWVSYEKRQFHNELKSNGIFVYRRYYDGVCLNGIKYRGPDPRQEVDAGPIRRLRLNIVG